MQVAETAPDPYVMPFVEQAESKDPGWVTWQQPQAMRPLLPLSQAIPAQSQIGVHAESELKGKQEDVYAGLRSQAAGYGQQAQDVMGAGREAAGRASGDLSKSLVAASAGRNPWAAQQAGVDAARERASILSQATLDAGQLEQMKLDKHYEEAEARNMVLPDSVRAQQEVDAALIMMQNALSDGADETGAGDLGLWDWGDHRYPWAQMYNQAMLALAAQTTASGRAFFESFLNEVLMEWEYYQNVKYGKGEAVDKRQPGDAAFTAEAPTDDSWQTS